MRLAGPPGASPSQKHTNAFSVLKPLLETANRPLPDMNKIYIGAKSMIEVSSYRGLTRSILDHDIPLIKTAITLDHYTKSDGFWGIMGSRELHLAPITRRLGQGELDTFAREHGLYGYVDTNGKATADLRKAAADLFYTSFTSPVISDSHWKIFAENQNGYRLRFEIEPDGGANLCSIRYQGDETLLKKVNDALVAANLPRFIAQGVSRIGAYFLPDSLSFEEEKRLLVKRFEGGDAPVKTGCQGDYWPVSINSSSKTANLELIEIGVRKRDPTEVQEKLPRWCADIPVVVDQ